MVPIQVCSFDIHTRFQCSHCGEFWEYENACNSFRSKEAKMRHNRTPSLELNAISTCFPDTNHPFLFCMLDVVNGYASALSHRFPSAHCIQQ